MGITIFFIVYIIHTAENLAYMSPEDRHKERTQYCKIHIVSKKIYIYLRNIRGVSNKKHGAIDVVLPRPV